MKKIFTLAAMAAFVFAFNSCEQNDPTVEGSGEGTKEPTETATGVVLNELSGIKIDGVKTKYIELYNTSDKEVSLEGMTLVKYDVGKEGGKSTTWTGAKGMKIAAKGFVVLESSDMADPLEDGDPDYKFESENHIFQGGLSAKKNIWIELYGADGKVLDEFKRGEESSLGWNENSLPEDKNNTFSRCPDGTGEWAYAAPTKAKANGAKTGDILHDPEL